MIYAAIKNVTPTSLLSHYFASGTALVPIENRSTATDPTVSSTPKSSGRTANTKTYVGPTTVTPGKGTVIG